jgi:hypothetical protein
MKLLTFGNCLCPAGLSGQAMLQWALVQQQLVVPQGVPRAVQVCGAERCTSLGQ